jgi:hypothetical protein
MLIKEKVIHTCWAYCTISVETNHRCEEQRQYSWPANAYLADKITCRFPVQCYVARHLWLLTETLLTPLFHYSHQPFCYVLCKAKNYLQLNFTARCRNLPPLSMVFFLHFLFISLMSTFLPEKIAIWQLLYSTTCCPSIGVHFFNALLYTVQSCYSILQTAKLVRWKWTFLSCWTVEICTDIGISNLYSLTL